jgi:hypothetical protein
MEIKESNEKRTSRVNSDIFTLRNTGFEKHDQDDSSYKRKMEERETLRFTQVDKNNSVVIKNTSLSSRHLWFNVFINLILVILLGFQLSLLNYASVKDYD